MDPAAAAELAALAGVTMPPGEAAHAEDLYAAAMLASEDYRDHQAEVWGVLVARQWSTEPSWADLFDELTPERAQRLGQLYDALPDGARAEYDRRYGQPERA